MELEYSEEFDAFVIVIPDSAINQLGWDDGDMLEYEIEEGIIRVFKYD